MKLKIITLTFLVLTLLAQEAYAARKWKEHKSTHFIVYYHGAPYDFVKNIEEAAERYYTEILNDLGFRRYKGWSFDKRAKIFIYDSQEDYVQMANMSNWSHGAAMARTKEIHTFPAAHGFFDSVLPHELAHIIFREYVGYRSQIPLWFEEGVAMYAEKGKRWGANQTVKKAIASNTFISLQDLGRVRLTNQTPKDAVTLFYAESASIVYYMITEMGKMRFVNLCRKLKAGRQFDYALFANYPRFRNMEDLNKAWIRYLK